MNGYSYLISNLIAIVSETTFAFRCSALLIKFRLHVFISSALGYCLSLHFDIIDLECCLMSMTNIQCKNMISKQK